MEMREILAALVISACAWSQPAGANYDESTVPNYTLPDPLKMQDGTPVRDAKTWTAKRRPEIVRLFEENVYGRAPGRPPAESFELTSIEKRALDGAAVRKQVTIRLAQGGPDLHLL